MKEVKISDFMREDYKNYWRHENVNKNAFDPREGLKVIERKVLFAAKMLNLQLYEAVLTRKLASDTGLYHISGEATVQDTIKGMASTYKRQPQTCLLKGIGAFPTSASNTGAAARYTSIVSTPLSRKIFEDLNFCPWIVDDTGIKQPKYISPPMPIVLIRGTKGIGVGKACYVTERKYEDVLKWSRKIIDLAYPESYGTGWSKSFLEEIKNTGINSTEDIRNFHSEEIKHNPIQNEDKIKKIKMPEAYNFLGSRVEYDYKRGTVMFYPRIETEIEKKTKHYYITALPLESSDKIVEINIRAKYGDKIADQCIDHSGKGFPIKLEIPKKIAEDESAWFKLRMKRGFTEAYCIWDEELDTSRIIKYLYPVLLEWYKAREEVVTKRLFKQISSSYKKISENNLIMKYYELREDKKIKTQVDAEKFFEKDETIFLINLPEKTYLKENIEKITDLNIQLELKIENTKNDIYNIKDFIFKEWVDVCEENRKFIEG